MKSAMDWARLGVQRACFIPGACSFLPPDQPGGLARDTPELALFFLFLLSLEPSYLPKENKEVTR